MKILDVVQGSDEWLKARLGVPTASRFKDIVTPTKADKSKSQDRYMYELLAELITGKQETYTNEHIERGNELEPKARLAYEIATGNEVREVGIMLDNGIGASPDGLIGSEGGLEIKCPKSTTVVKYLLENRLPLEYKPQVMGNLWISGRKWWDFVVYHPDFDIFILRVEREEEYIQKLAKEVMAFKQKLEEKFKILSVR